MRCPSNTFGSKYFAEFDTFGLTENIFKIYQIYFLVKIVKNLIGEENFQTFTASSDIFGSSRMWTILLG